MTTWNMLLVYRCRKLRREGNNRGATVYAVDLNSSNLGNLIRNNIIYDFKISNDWAQTILRTQQIRKKGN